MDAGHRPSRVYRSRPVPTTVWDGLSSDLHPVLRRVLAARGISADQADPTLSRLVPVGLLPGVGQAVERLAAARARQERIVLVGDYDADGATATALAVSCLRAFGYRNVDYLVPSRFAWGYGLSPPVAEQAATSGPGLLVTVDNGIASLAGVRRAADLGLEVIVTDHHLPGAELPAPAIIVGPSVPGSTFPSPALCGVGVAFYLMAALGRALAGAGIVTADVARGAVTDCLDLVALGTVADMVPLDFNNRVLVAEGLRRIRSGRTRPGIRALFAVAGRDRSRASAADLGFGIAPRLNAAGRLDDMTIGIECLLTGSPGTAAHLAAHLHKLNAERREIQARMETEAGDLLAATVEPDGREEALCLCLFDERWHEGVVGLVANRLREKTGRPALAFARAGGPGLLKGSARSVTGINLRDAIAVAVGSLDDGNIRFGGHAMAAGITLPEETFPAFARAMGAALEGQRDLLSGPELSWTDGPLDPQDLCLELAEILAAAGPWGQGFAEPVFDNQLVMLGQRVVGAGHLHLDLRHPGGGNPIAAIAFNQPPLAATAGTVMRCRYRLEVDAFGQNRRPRLVVECLDCD